jgi:hypothetical protein
MKRAIYLILAVMLLTSTTGCLSRYTRGPQSCAAEGCQQGPENCASCGCDGNGCQDPSQCADQGDPSDNGPGHCCRLFHRRGDNGDGGDEGFNPGPTAGTIAYPYYTTRGPRDFLARNPQSIGP